MAAVTVTAGGTSILEISASSSRTRHVYITHDGAGTLWVDSTSGLTSATGVAVPASPRFRGSLFVVSSATTLYGISTTDVNVRYLVI